MAEHNETGEVGERIAAQYLISKGYQIVERNWRFGRYELDIIASKGDDIIFIEVKTRSNERFMPTYKSIDKRKIKNIVLAADKYIKVHHIELNIRFDIVILVGDLQSPKITHWENAFYPPLNTK